jgi:hypothetical protein
MNFPRLFGAAPRSCPSVLVVLRQAHWSAGAGGAFHALAVGVLPAAFLLVTTREEIYNILWALVFGFATLNILSLGARRFDAHKAGLNFGEVLAILIVVVAIVLLGWEMLYLFDILPIRITPH